MNTTCKVCLRQSPFYATRIARQSFSSSTRQHSLPADPTRSPPAATSTSAAQPFSTPFTPSAKNTPGFDPKASSSSKPARPLSSVIAGTPLRGLDYIKNREAPVAREDHEYPDWLWGLLDNSKVKKGQEAKEESAGDAFAKSAKQRRLAAKAARARQALQGTREDQGPRVPVQEQSIDLPTDRVDKADGKTLQDDGLKARHQLTEAMRVARRKGIRERNYLKQL